MACVLFLLVERQYSSIGGQCRIAFVGAADGDGIIYALKLKRRVALHT